MSVPHSPAPVDAQDPQGSVTAHIFVQIVLIIEFMGINIYLNMLFNVYLPISLVYFLMI